MNSLAYDKVEKLYRRFVSSWGTHYTTRVTMGGKMMSRKFFDKKEGRKEGRRKEELRMN